MTRAAREARELAAAICEALTVPHPARPLVVKVSGWLIWKVPGTWWSR
jgi:hypothetical protein